MVEFLIEHHAEVNSKTEEGLTPIHLAADGGHANVTKFLIEHGADVNATELKNVTPLHEAARIGNCR